MQIYDDIGLDVFDIGQEAKIPLKTFDKTHESGDYFEKLVSKIEAEGFTYQIVRAKDFEKYRETFNHINKEWEKNSNYIERDFIPGKYDETYMKDMDFSILKDGKICAFSVFLQQRAVMKYLLMW